MKVIDCFLSWAFNMKLMGKDIGFFNFCVILVISTGSILAISFYLSLLIFKL